MPAFDPTAVVEGDSLRYVMPTTGSSMSVTVYGIRNQSVEGIEIYTDYMRRNDGRAPVFLRRVKSSWVTHRNRLRITHQSASNVSRQKPKQLSILLHTEAGHQTVSTTEKEAIMANRKSLDEMSEAHRSHIEKWEPHLEALQGEHVWAAVNRTPGRGVTGPVYVALKRAAKDYAVVDYDTEKRFDVTAKRILADGFESSSALMEAFKAYRQMAKTERLEAREAKKPAAKKTAAKPAKPVAKRVKKPQTATVKADE